MNHATTNSFPGAFGKTGKLAERESAYVQNSQDSQDSRFPDRAGKQNGNPGPDDPDATREDWTGVTLESFARSAAEVAQLHAYLRQRGRIQAEPKGKRKP